MCVYKFAIEKFRSCAGGRLRPEGLLIVSILYAGVRLEEKFRFCAGASQNLAPKLRRALRAFNLPEPFQGLLKAFQGPAAVGRPSTRSKEASRKGPIQKETPAARKFRFCAGGRLRPEGLLIVSILHAGVCLEVCEFQGLSKPSQAWSLLGAS